MSHILYQYCVWLFITRNIKMKLILILRQFSIVNLYQLSQLVMEIISMIY